MAIGDLAESFDARLASEGLGELDTDGQVSRQRVGAPAGAEAVDAYLAWARDVLTSHWFPNARAERIWAMYAEGASLTIISDAVGGSRRSVTKALARVMAASPPPPGPNPWRKDGHAPVTRPRQLRALALRAEPDMRAELFVAALRMGVVDGPELEDRMESKKTVHYDKIFFVRAQQMPGNPVLKDRLLNVDGRPHAGGIDVMIERKDQDGIVETIVGIPWQLILRTERAVVEA